MTVAPVATTPPPRKVSRPRVILWPVLALVLMLAFNLAFTDGFFHIEMKDGHLFGSLIDVLKNAVPVALTAIGMTLVIATGGVDLSVGTVMAIAGQLTVRLLVMEHWSMPSACAAGLGVALLCGVWNGFLVGYLNIQPIVATLILFVAGRGIAELITDGQIVTLHNPAFEFLGHGFLFALPFQITIVLGVLLLVSLLTRRTAAGLFIESVGNNPTAARFSGINQRFIKLLVYSFAGLCAGIAGLIIASNTAQADPHHAGLNVELDAILAVVIGGTSLMGGRFLLIGSMIGALIIQTMDTTIRTRGVAVEWTLVVKAIVVVAVCLLQAPKFQRLFRRGR
jgi:simple sugar transport system permease protein